MSGKSITLIVSDLHLGGGKDDRGDDHVYHKNQFREFIKEQTATPSGLSGKIELIINGDFLEFAQVLPDIFKPKSKKFWCSEKESLKKLDVILKGHADIFTALSQFQTKGNEVTIAAGNHDVDLYWDAVQTKLRKAAGPVNFETGQVWYSRYQEKLLISHGHMFDPANKFKNWADPFLVDDSGTLRLEMCGGTLFMVKFVNKLEATYPFIDNIKPYSALGPIFLKEDRNGFFTAGALFSRFLLRHPGISLSTRKLGVNIDIETQIIKALTRDDFALLFTQLYKKTRDRQATPKTVRDDLKKRVDVRDFLYDMMLIAPPEEWLPVLDKLPKEKSATLGIKTGAAKKGSKKSPTLSVIGSSQLISDAERLREQAYAQLQKGHQVVVMGHTHQPDILRLGKGVYFNPGSWTRFADIKEQKLLTLELLKKEDIYPYQLNYIYIKENSTGNLEAKSINYDQWSRTPNPSLAGKV